MRVFLALCCVVFHLASTYREPDPYLFKRGIVMVSWHEALHSQVSDGETEVL